MATCRERRADANDASTATAVTFARWFKKAPHRAERTRATCCTLERRELALAGPGHEAFTIPVPEAIIVITESEGDSTERSSSPTLSGPREIDAISREESNSDDESSDDTMLTDDTHYSHDGIGRILRLLP